jgi:uncharacterized membrane protein YecN with MAPEG domain
MTDLPITLATTGILGLLYIGLSVNVSRLRRGSMNAKDESGATPKQLAIAIRMHGNFSEYVPLGILLLGGLEYAGSSPTLVGLLAAMLILARILHPIGMQRPAPNPYRAFGALLTYGMITAGSIFAILLAFTRS